MSVQQSQLDTARMHVEICTRLVNELEQSPTRFHVEGSAKLTIAPSRLRAAKKELQQLTVAARQSLFGGAL